MLKLVKLKLKNTNKLKLNRKKKLVKMAKANNKITKS